jgi:membrane protein YqaA with SNARE-associated domain
MMTAATLFGIGVIGTVFWAASPEAAVALFTATRGWNPPVVAVVATGGQAVSATLLFLFGGELRRRWRWFDLKCERLRVRIGERMARRAPVVAVTSGLLGFPPLSLTATLAPALAPRPKPLLPILLAMRFVRFTVIAALAVYAAGRWPN